MATAIQNADEIAEGAPRQAPPQASGFYHARNCGGRGDGGTGGWRSFRRTRFGEVVPRDVREMYDRGLQYLAKTQTEKGDWAGGGGENGPGTTGMALMVFLACGEDPNFGPTATTFGWRCGASSRPRTRDGHHGAEHVSPRFRDARLAEAYGAVDERNLWPDGKGPRSIGQALELAVRAAITSQKKNPQRGLAVLARRPATPTPRSAARSSSACSRPATPASKSPTRRSTRRSPTTPR